MILLQNSEGMDQCDLGQSLKPEDVPAASAAAPASDSAASQPAATSRPRRPQRSAKVEGSIDIGEAKAEPTEAAAPPSDQQGGHVPDGPVASRPKPSRLGGPKGPGHHPVRAASVPHHPASRPMAPHLNPHAQRALSVAGTADTQAQTVDDFRQVSPVTACLNQSTFVFNAQNCIQRHPQASLYEQRKIKPKPPELQRATLVWTPV